MNRYVRISEYMWLMLSITCIGFTIFEFAYLKNNEHGLYALGFTVLAAAMYGMRRTVRRRMERAQKAQAGTKK